MFLSSVFDLVLCLVFTLFYLILFVELGEFLVEFFTLDFYLHLLFSV
jgi:hypothetical protein